MRSGKPTISRLGAIRRSRGEVIFSFFNGVFLVLFSMSIILPFLHILSVSFSSASEAARLGLHLYPREFSLTAYRRVLSSIYIWRGYLNTIIRTAFGTALSLSMTAAGGYVLSKKYIPHRVFWTALVVFTMFFSGGLIPVYLLVQSLGLIDSYLALILPSAVSAFNLLIMRNYFMTIPQSLEESARIDGTPEWRILVSIIMPIAKPMLATVGLWITVWHWGAWFDCLIYMRNPDKFVLQILLRRIILEGTQEILNMNMGEDVKQTAYPDSVRGAAIFVTTLPIMLVYPFIQKHFVKGIMVGSLKG